MLEPEPLSQPPLEPPSQLPLESLPDEPLLCEPLRDQSPPEPDSFDAPEPPRLPPEDQPELPERLMVIVQLLPPPQLELPLIMPSLDHLEPLSMIQDQPPMLTVCPEPRDRPRMN